MLQVCNVCHALRPVHPHRYLRAGVDGLLGRVKAAKLKNMPQDVSTAVATVERVEALQVELAAAKKVRCAHHDRAALPPTPHHQVPPADLT